MSTQSTSQSTSLFSMAHSKLRSALGGSVKDSCSLHRWVLLKNSMTRSHTPEAPPASEKADVPYVSRRDEDESREVEDEVNYMFPDPDALSLRPAGPGKSESQWLDSLLETLGGEDDDLDADGDAVVSISVCPVDDDDDDDEPLSPLYSPMSSSDDLAAQSSFFCNPHAIPVPYPIPYPPVCPSRSPVWLDMHSSSDSFLEAAPSLYHDPLPYYEVDDMEDLSVPDAIEDTSDDESDAPLTPFDHSTSSLAAVDPASVPLPPEQRRRSPSLLPQVYIDTDDAHFYPFELDPLPFHVDSPAETARVYRPPLYQEC
ncbi:uncharacterized protein FIBRA_05010 [Fibroporia radiculosa]|uniref:Uncharacterized protein n=1 Tax=Fibroporia radiculosa TaxID=599839 RepID=J4IAH0_9APHY|nr:uncharacterized protein FIBRA_05010 [Fibroporia radiculosa]CCM02896.1 predicted protein [Fibroporia radiculosa]